MARKFAEQYPDKILNVRYEHLVREPEEAVLEICQFIDLAYSERLLSRTDHYQEIEKAQSVVYFENAFRTITDENIGKGRRQMGKSKKKDIMPILNDTLSRHGYERLIN
ncbi:hypothetical protein GGP52_003057 [Salinibacter ruber]|nr:hypothetical protein [Salinibacter ruber]